MRGVPSFTVLAALALAAVAASSHAAAGAAAPARATPPAVPSTQGLTPGIIEPPELNRAEAPAAFARLRRAGVRFVRIQISWYGTAPGIEPASWNPANPNDPSYNWSAADAKVRQIANAGFVPVVAVNDSPAWARWYSHYNQSPVKADAFGAFLRAAATRYNGANGFPRVRYWQIWIEPNLSPFFTPQFDENTKQFTSPQRYREMVNAAYDALHSVRGDNVVIAGSTAPFRDITPDVQAIDRNWGPLKFMRQLLCLGENLQRACTDPIRFDVWSHHPYTSGNPTHKAFAPNDASLGDLGDIRAILNAGIRVGNVTTPARIRFWVTEFSWDSNPPDPCSPPLGLLMRWVPEAMYRMWSHGVDAVFWLQLRDDPPQTSFYQSGLWFAGRTFAADRPKPHMQGFRFPFVALKQGTRVLLWARTPTGRAGRVVVERKVGRRWARVTVLAADRLGIARRVVTAPLSGSYRAVFGREASLPFSMKVPRDMFVNPFGSPTLLEDDNPTCR